MTSKMSDLVLRICRKMMEDGLYLMWVCVVVGLVTRRLKESKNDLPLVNLELPVVG